MYDVQERTDTAVGSVDQRRLVALPANTGDDASDDLNMKVPLTTGPKPSRCGAESVPHCHCEQSHTQQCEAVGCQ
jgi:hypothetical protein